MSEGTRTPDRLDHNQELYQLSYAHHESSDRSLAAGCRRRLSRAAAARRASSRSASASASLGARPAARVETSRQAASRRSASGPSSVASATPSASASPAEVPSCAGSPLSTAPPRRPRRDPGPSQPPPPERRPRLLVHPRDDLARMREHALGHVLALALGGAPAAAHRELIHRDLRPFEDQDRAGARIPPEFTGLEHTVVDPRLDDRPQLRVVDVERVEAVGELAQLHVEHAAKARTSARAARAAPAPGARA